MNIKKEIDGVIILNKPLQISSNSASNKVKWLLSAKKAGHLGTLDPLATGVLPVALGKATKLFDRFLKKTKTYIATFEFGYETDTLDCEGEIENKKDCDITIGDINKVLDDFKGEISQMPPKYSAKRVNGKRAYDLARAGIEFTLSPKNITIYEIKVLNKLNKNIFEFEITCSSGTYIRSIARDMAYKLNTYGTMIKLVRTKCGIFDIKNAVTFEDIEKGNYTLINLDTINQLLEEN